MLGQKQLSTETILSLPDNQLSLAPMDALANVDEPKQEYLLSFGNDLDKSVNPDTSKFVSSTATPFVKWVGGKRSIIETLKNYLPLQFNGYWEPFSGGAALFFELRSKLFEAHLSDTNLDLVLTYKVIQKDIDLLMQKLKHHAQKHNEDYYYEVRSHQNLKDPIEIAARFIYLNKTCYNGLYRVNRKGEFNVPFGRYTNPGILQEQNLRAVHTALKNVDIRYGDFRDIQPKTGDFAYFDPPYHPTNETSFTKYHRLDFSQKDQAKLRDFALTLHKKGILVMLSNSDTRFIRDLYCQKAFKIHQVMAPRFVNCKPNKRSSVNEVIITNY